MALAILLLMIYAVVRIISKEEDGVSFTTWPVANISIDPSAGKPIHMSKLQTKHGAACLILNTKDFSSDLKIPASSMFWRATFTSSSISPMGCALQQAMPLPYHQ